MGETPEAHASHTGGDSDGTHTVDEPVTMSRTAVSLGAASLALGDYRGESGDEALAGAWWRCGDDGEGWITDEADVEIAAEYLRAVAGKN